jgi:hypothetical protein
LFDVVEVCPIDGEEACAALVLRERCLWMFLLGAILAVACAREVFRREWGISDAASNN